MSPPVHQCSLCPLEPKQHAGFTLLETLLYLVLFGFIATTLVALNYQIVKHTKLAVQSGKRSAEASFIDNKLKWLVNNSELVTPAINTEAKVLTLRDSNNGSVITVYQIRNQLVLSRDTSTLLPLTGPTHNLTDVNFKLGEDLQLIINFKLDGESYTFPQFTWPEAAGLHSLDIDFDPDCCTYRHHS